MKRTAMDMLRNLERRVARLESPYPVAFNILSNKTDLLIIKTPYADELKSELFTFVSHQLKTIRPEFRAGHYTNLYNIERVITTDEGHFKIVGARQLFGRDTTSLRDFQEDFDLCLREWAFHTGGEIAGEEGVWYTK